MLGSTFLITKNMVFDEFW